MQDDLPRAISHSSQYWCIPAGVRVFMTHVTWRNSWGSLQPETGVRFGPDFNDFILIEHGWPEFNAAAAYIVSRIARGRSLGKISDDMNDFHSEGRADRIKAVLGVKIKKAFDN